LLEHDQPITRAWVLHPDVKSNPDRRLAEPALAEGVSLAAALPNLEVVGAEVVRLPKIHPGMLFGKGKIEELKQRLHDAEAELVLVDGPVSPVQQRNLEKAWGVKLLDRTGLILEIFSDRARTAEGVLQVEMAALSYRGRPPRHRHAAQSAAWPACQSRENPDPAPRSTRQSAVPDRGLSSPNQTGPKTFTPFQPSPAMGWTRCLMIWPASSKIHGQRRR